MPYRVEFTRSAAKALRKLSKQAQRRVLRKTESLGEDPRPPGVRQIDAGLFRVRTGDYRILYSINDGVFLVLVLLVGHRRDIYEALRRLNP